MCTSVCFGGGDLQDLYVVSGSAGTGHARGGAVHCVRTAVAGLPVPHGVTFSMGAAVVDAHNQDTRGADYDALIERADRRLYQAKREGRSTWR